MRFSLALGVLLAGMAQAGLAQEGKAVYEPSPDSSRIKGPERQFVMELIQRGMGQIEISKLAATNSSSSLVKGLASKLEGDQTKTSEDLRTVAGEKNWTLPGKIEKTDQEQYARLKKMKGSQFDQTYIGLMLERNNQDLAKVKDEAENGKDPDLRSFAQRTKATVEDHIQEIKDVQKTVK